MALRRQLPAQVQGFDEMLGPGAYFPSCEEGDLAYSVLKAGLPLIHVPSAAVTHYGFRSWEAGSGLTRRTYVSIAAAYMKHVRQGDLVAALVILQQFWLAAANLLTAMLQRRKPFGIGRLFSLAQGVWRSFELAIDPATNTYQPHSGKTKAAIV